MYKFYIYFYIHIKINFKLNKTKYKISYKKKKKYAIVKPSFKVTNLKNSKPFKKKIVKKKQLFPTQKKINK